MKLDLMIYHGDTFMYPAVQEGIELALERKGTPGKLTFTVVQDDVLDFTEGDAVKLAVDGEDVFYGYVFSKKRNKEQFISVTAYDQLRYLKNKDCFQYENKTATEVIQLLADDFLLKTGVLEDTKHKIPYRLEDNTSLFDIIQTALDETLLAEKQLYVLYDDVGKLTLRNVENMKLDLLLDADTLENFDYQSSIDDATYNQVKVVYNNSETGDLDTYEVMDIPNIKAWGVLQLTEKVQEAANSKTKAEDLLALYNSKTRTLRASGVLGRTDVRAGCSVVVQLALGDVTVSNNMMVESVRHTWNEQQHLMNLNLRGGIFIG